MTEEEIVNEWISRLRNRQTKGATLSELASKSGQTRKALTHLLKERGVWELSVLRRANFDLESVAAVRDSLDRERQADVADAAPDYSQWTLGEEIRHLERAIQLSTGMTFDGQAHYRKRKGRWQQKMKTDWGVIGCFIIPIFILGILWIVGGGLSQEEHQTSEQQICTRQGRTCDADGVPIQ